MSSNDSIKLVNRAQLAAIFGKSLVTIDSWIRRGMPIVEKGNKTKEWKFDTAEVAQWREEQAVACALGNDENLGIEDLKKRKLVAEVNLLEVDLQERKKEVIPLKEVEQGLSHAYITIKQRLRTIPDRIVPELASQKDENICRELLINEIDDALLELSQMDFDASQTE